MTKKQAAGRRPTKRRARSITYDTPPAAVLSVDPPWEHEDELGRRGARAKYSTMSTEEICMMDRPPLAKRHVLVLWKLANMPQDALNVCRAWMTEPLAEIVWEKLRPCQVCAATGLVDRYLIDDQPELYVPGTMNRCPACFGKRGRELTDKELGTFPAFMGLGRTVRSAHETAIIARPIDGRAPERLHLDVRSYFAAPMLIDIDGDLPESRLPDGRRSCAACRPGKPCSDAHARRRGALVHSAKPDEFYAMLERLYPGPHVELFGRRSRAGWHVIGDQDRKLDEVVRKMRDVWPERVREKRLARARARRRG